VSDVLKTLMAEAVVILE